MPNPVTDEEPDAAPRTLTPAERVVPSRIDPLAAAATRPLGGPVGEHAAIGRHWFWSPQRVGLAVAVLALVVCWFGKASCIQQYTDSSGATQLDWRAGRPFVAMCYSDIVPLYSSERLNDPHTFPYVSSWKEDTQTAENQTRYMEYPVVSGLFQWADAKLAAAWLSVAGSGWLPGALPVAIYFDISAFWLALAWLVTVWATGRTVKRRPWDALLVAASPLVFVHAFTNFDAIATACTAAALLAWSRRRPEVAGLLLGLGAATKLYPLLLLGVLFVLCLRAGKLREWRRAALFTALTWLVVNVPLMLVATRGWWEFFRLNALRPMDPDSLYNAFSYATGWTGFDGVLHKGQSPTWLNTVVAVLFLICCAGIAYLALTAPRRPRLGQLAFLVVAAFLLTNKVWSPQYSLWLVPLAVLAIPRWRLLLGWMVLDALVWAPRMFYYLGTDHKGLPEGWFLGTVVLRDLAVLGLCVLVIREVYRPRTDLVRLSGDDDPAGGVLDRARDRVRLPGWRSRAAPAAAPRT
ncbi:glycosyltransferase 87 family protein [Amycolatopsis sp. PS_44_ISF1]|uniref:glycosyltransferase family 87 protein n=1 Tax=Amycolatopsis sp. PS_44_ISF1 TaxID=2974917 RepID=UPI0028DE713D|nr:glycosyltransferase 87 family protein [Amycolatopsis sp. PS_44_ISF1]MDT8910500.1 glycosyltransferase 87 family protein [Amycolatopsis sp. PS_44_ISF1]